MRNLVRGVFFVFAPQKYEWLVGWGKNMVVYQENDEYREEEARWKNGEISTVLGEKYII